MIKNFSLVIVSFHSENIIEKTIENFLDQEIIIVDCSNDKKLKQKFALKYPNIKYILSPINLGYGAGNNLGIKHTTFNNVLILNPDALMSKNSKKELLNYINEIAYYGILCPNMSNEQGKKFSIDNNFKPTKIDWRLGEHFLVGGCALLFNKEVLKNDIFFDEKIWMYKEDTDLLKRVYDKKIPIYFLPKCSINHLGSKSHSLKFDQELSISRQFHWPYGNVFFYKKHYSFLKAFKLWGMKMIRALLKTIFYLMIFNKKYKVYLARFMGASSAFLGIRPWYRPKIKN